MKLSETPERPFYSPQRIFSLSFLNIFVCAYLSPCYFSPVAPAHLCLPHTQRDEVVHLLFDAFGSLLVMTGGPPNGAPARLLVPSADVTAKNLRATLHAYSASKSTYNYDSDGRLQRRAMSIFDKLTSTPRPVDDGERPKFFRLVDDTPSLLTRFRAFITRLKSQRAESKKKRVVGESKALRILARICELIDYCPIPPMSLFLGSVFTTVMVNILRPSFALRFEWMPSVLDGCIIFSTLLCFAWKRGPVLRAINRNESPYRHPIDDALEPYAEYIEEKHAAVKAGNEELKTNFAQLDALRRELARDPAAADKNAILKPSQRAKAMIEAGALGAGYDAEKAAEAERIKKEESLRRSHQLWRERSGNNEVDEAIEKLKSFAATGYRMKTKELKQRAAPRPVPPAVAALRRGGVAAATVASAANALASGLASGGGSGGPRASTEGSGERNSGSGTSGSNPMPGRPTLPLNATFASFNSFAPPGAADTSRRYSGSNASVRSTASAPLSTSNARKPKMRIFRRKQRTSPDIAAALDGNGNANNRDVFVEPLGPQLIPMVQTVPESDAGREPTHEHRRMPSFPRLSGRRARKASRALAAGPPGTPNRGGD